MSFNFLLAGSLGPDPLMFAASVALVLAWKTAGYWGLDYFLLPLIGTPWGHHPAEPDPVARRRAAVRRRRAVQAATGLSVVALALIAFTALGAPGTRAAAPPPVDGPATLTMGAADFRPAALSLRAGATVTWQNPSKIPHTVTSGAASRADGRFDSGLLPAGGEFQYTFTAPGVYAYYCAFHPGMVGTITVVE
jgi:plastocyanin